ncbi:hypothetical protein SUGI_0748940 [Cryptomeria japonica]|nr:hypothetical protein SUGI_0748940 [Cryptomeria japonica]
MAWKKIYLDLALVPPSLFLLVLYHIFLCYKIKKTPLQTITGVNSVGRRLWVETLIEDTDKKNILAVQTMRNMIMQSTLVGTISALLSTGLAAVMSSTYSLNKQQPAENTILFGAHHNELLVAVKYATPLMFLLLSFFCSSLSIRFLNQCCYARWPYCLCSTI